MTKLFCIHVHFFFNLILLPHDCLLNYQLHDSLIQPVQSYFLYVINTAGTANLNTNPDTLKSRVLSYLLVAPERM